VIVQVWVVKESATCTCAEAHVSHRRLGAARLHNCRYIRARNALIPLAEQRASVRAPQGGPEWTAAYLMAMEHLVEEARISGLL
jgi:hypothetical protein